MNTINETNTIVIANEETEQTQDSVQVIYDADYYTEKALALFDQLNEERGMATNYTAKGIKANINAWLKNKECLFNTLRNHPNWNEEAKAIIIPSVNYERTATDSEKRRAVRNLMNYCVSEEEINTFQKRDAFRYSLADFILRLADTQFVDSETEIFKRVDEEFPEVKIHNGQKASRVINKIFKVLGVDKYPDYNKYFAKFADICNPLIIKRTSILSANWMDFMTMSVGNSWTSCHDITYNALAGGCNRAGCMSYGTDSVSLIFYTIEDNDRKTDFYAVPKINRQVVFWQYPVMVQERLYPQCHDSDNAELANSPVKQFRNILESIMATCVNKPNLWEKCSGLNIYREEDCFMYEDWSCFDNWVVKIKGEENAINEMFIGSDCYCLECGDKKYDNGNDGDFNSLFCKSCGEYDEIRCEHCGDRVSNRDDLHWCPDTSEYRCDDCCCWCEYHEEYESYSVNRMYYIENYGYVCPDALDNGDFFYCEHCDNYFYGIDHDRFNVKSGRYYEVWCDDCVDDDAIRCYECGEIYDKNNCETDFHIHEGEDYCSECVEKLDLLVTCKNCGEVTIVDEALDTEDGYFCCDYCYDMFCKEHDKELVTVNCECE